MLKKQEITFQTSDRLVQFLKQEGYDLQYGARPLKRLIQKKVMDALSIALLEGRVQPGMEIRMDVENKRVVFEPIKGPVVAED